MHSQAHPGERQSPARPLAGLLLLSLEPPASRRRTFSSQRRRGCRFAVEAKFGLDPLGRVLAGRGQDAVAVETIEWADCQVEPVGSFLRVVAAMASTGGQRRPMRDRTAPIQMTSTPTVQR